MNSPSSSPPPTILWLRRDLRLADNAALADAIGRGGAVIPLFILDDAQAGRPLGGASRWWLGTSLAALGGSLQAIGSRLILRRGPPAEVLSQVAAETGAGAVVWNRVAEPAAAATDAAVRARLAGHGVQLHAFKANLLTEPGQVTNGGGEPYRVFTAYWRAARARLTLDPLIAPPAWLRPPATWPHGDGLDDWELHPTPDWSTGLAAAWTPGEAGAFARLDAFLERGLKGYGAGRDRLADGAQSRLSPHLHWGEIAAHRVLRAAHAAVGMDQAPENDAEVFVRELGWRDFAHDLLAQAPDIAHRNLRPAFDGMPWSGSDAAFQAWAAGRTGYPAVDAAMRELWSTGYMTGRARMIVGSFLVKDLLIDWRRGEAWFWDTLVDAGLAANAMNWQWTAGSGVDAQPFFRIFNPVGQGRKFDPDGAYVRRWLPELAALADEVIHAPWTAGPLEMASLGPGATYPDPIVDHALARRRALDALAGL